MIHTTRFLPLCLIALMVGALPHSFAAAADDDDEGRIIQIGPEHAGGTPLTPGRRPHNPENPWQQPPVVVSRYWIGIEGSVVSPALRSHLNLKEGEGLLVNQVVPGSPADKGDLQVYDVIKRANNQPIDSIPELAEQVGKQAERKGRLALDIVRAGRPRTVWVAPGERPEQQDLFPPRQLMPRQVQPRQPQVRPGNVRMQFGQQQKFSMQGGVSIRITRNNQEPVKIVVKRGDETWEIEGEDAEALETLPEELRPRVQRMLAPEQRGGIRGQERLEQLQQQLMQRQLNNLQQGGNPGLFANPLRPEVEQATPSELELPSEIDLPAE